MTDSLLCVDIGNSKTVLGLWRGEGVEGAIVRDWRLATDERRTSDELAVLLAGLLYSEGVRNIGHELTGIVVCSTVPVVLQEWRHLLATHWADLPSLIVEPGVRTGVPVLMDNPREVGTDRIMNSLAVAEHIGGPAIVVDFSTATTFDVVNADNQYVGGAIAPGVELSLSALRERAAQLRQVELVRPRTVIAKNTVEALQSGALYGFAAQVDGLVERMLAEMGLDAAEVTVVATGEQAHLIEDECRTITRREPHLTLWGLASAFRRNRPRA